MFLLFSFSTSAVSVWNIHLQSSPFKTLCLGSIGMDCVISELCYSGTILQSNYLKSTILISWSFSYNYFLKFHSKENVGATT